MCIAVIVSVSYPGSCQISSATNFSRRCFRRGLRSKYAEGILLQLQVPFNVENDV